MFYVLSFFLKFYATRNWLSADLSSDIVRKREHVSVRTGRLKGENRGNSHQKNEQSSASSSFLSLSFSQLLSERRPQSRELTTNNYRLKFSRNKVSLDNILGAMSLCFSASGFIEYRRLDVFLSSKEPRYIFELFRIAYIFIVLLFL